VWITKQRMVVAVVFILVIGTTGWFSRSVSAGQLRGSARDTQAVSIISGLDDCLQERFRDVNERFGMARIIKPGDTAHRLQPDNIREVTTVRNLEQANLRVALGNWELGVGS
jgi:hypothetical protein